MHMKANQQREFVQLAMQSQNRIYRFVLSLVPNYTEAEELTQQTILTLWEKWVEFDPDGDFTAWAFGIARNHVLNHIRKKSRRDERVGLSDAALERVSQLQQQKADELEERRAALHGCLDSLQEPHRELIESYYDGHVSVPDLAQQLGRSAEALYKTLQRIRKALFDCINRKVALEAGK